MNPGQMITYIVMIAVGTLSMAFKSKCFQPLCFFNYFCLTGGMLAVYAFAESLFDTLAPKKETGAIASLRHLQTTQEEGPARNREAENTFIGKMNASILKNPWIAQFLERDYYGLGQTREMEPPALLKRMETSALMAGAALPMLVKIFGFSFNPGIMMVGFVLGFFLPHMKAQRAIGERQKRALMNLPSFVDLLALTIESGLDYLNSMEKILQTTFKNRGPLEEELDNVLRQVQLGYPRRDALRNMSKRVDVQEVRSLVGLLIQSDELGTGLVGLLRNFSQDMRNRRTGRAEEMAGKASTKMLGPMMIFIFPVIFVLILAPFAVSLMKGGGMSF